MGHDKNSDISKLNYKTLLIEDIKYRTTLTEKYKKRKQFQRKNIKQMIAFIPGTIGKISVKEKSKVKIGDQLLVLEAMKMKNNILAPLNGIIKKIHVSTGDRVRKDQIIIEFE